MYKSPELGDQAEGHELSTLGSFLPMCGVSVTEDQAAMHVDIHADIQRALSE